MNPLTRLLGLSLPLLLALLVGGLVAQAWLARHQAEAEARQWERTIAQWEHARALTGGDEAPWNEARLATLRVLLDARLEVNPPATPAGPHLVHLLPEGEPLVLQPRASPAARQWLLQQRVLLALGLTALVLFVALFALTLWWRPTASPAPAATPPDWRSLTTLARTTAAQGEALAQERDDRQRAEEAARFRLDLLNQALEERIRLGRDLHDGVIQSLYAAGLTLEAAGQLLATDPAQAAARLDNGKTILNQAIADTRAHLAGLAPARVRRDSLATALRALVHEQRADQPLVLDLHVDEAAPAQLPDERIADLFQITREAVSNALRHGQARRLTLRLEEAETGGVNLTLGDDGQGFDPARPSAAGHHGLLNLRARAEQAGGIFTLDSRPGGGTRLHVHWPVPIPTSN
jgi:signal transduction histidine kinase